VKIVRRISIIALATLAATGATVTAANAAPASTTPQKHTVQSVQAHVGVRVQHVTTKMQTLRVRITANKRFTVATKATLQADVAKVLTDAAAWRTRISAATTMVAIRAAAPAKVTVDNDLAKLRTDLTAARKQVTAAAPAQ
jgi:hypothetical protein